MDLKDTKEQLSVQELELLKDFQMEELEERMEMKSWFRDGAKTEIGAGDPGGVQPPSETEPTPPPSTPPGTTPIGGVIVSF